MLLLQFYTALVYLPVLSQMINRNAQPHCLQKQDHSSGMIAGHSASAHADPHANPEWPLKIFDRALRTPDGHGNDRHCSPS